MPASAEAKKNPDELFPGHVSTLKVTDPELIEYFDNFAFDEVIRNGNLDTRTRLMVQLRVDEMYGAAPEDEMHLQRLLSANCFGDHYTRTGVDIKTRELLTFATLISLGGCDPQAKGHVAANLNVGNDRSTLLSVITPLLPFIGYPRTLNALRAINEVTPA